MKRLAALTALGMVLAGLVGVPASASTFKSCKALQAVYKNGVASSKAWKNKGPGPIFTPRISASVFSQNKRLDLDKDGIVCEKRRPAPPSPAPEAPVAAPTKSNSVLALRVREATSTSAASITKVTYVSEAPQLSFGNLELIKSFEKHLVWLTGTGVVLKNPLVVVIPRTAAWMNDEIARQGCGRYSLAIGAYAIWSECGGKSVVTRPDIETEGGNWTSLSAQHVMIHEAWHQWQRETVSTRFGNADYPKWIWEGSAQAVSRYAMWSIGDQIQDPEAMLTSWYTSDRPDLRAACVGVKIREMIPNTPWPDKANCAYSKGQVASDLFVEKFGFSALIEIFRQPKRSGMSDFPLIFREVTGMELEAFYDEVDLAMENRGWR